MTLLGYLDPKDQSKLAGYQTAMVLHRGFFESQSHLKASIGLLDNEQK